MIPMWALLLAGAGVGCMLHLIVFVLLIVIVTIKYKEFPEACDWNSLGYSLTYTAVVGAGAGAIAYVCQLYS